MTNQGGKETVILVVDDESVLADALSDFLAHKGYKVLTAYSGHQGIEFFKTNHIDFVVSDVKMHDGDGTDLLREIRNIQPNPPPYIYMMSGFTSYNEDYFISKGATGYFKKPLKILDLVQKIESHFSH
jgi:DNA-binding response OmpR family regulator